MNLVLFDDMMETTRKNEFSSINDDILNKTKLESVLKYALDNFAIKVILFLQGTTLKFKKMCYRKERESQWLKNRIFKKYSST